MEDLNYQVWHTLFETMEIMRMYSDRYSPGLRPDLKAPLAHVKVMGCLLQSNQHMKIKEIAAQLGITPGAVSQTVDQLVKLGLLERCVSDTDRRAVSVTLSAEGRRKREQMDVFFTETVALATAGIPAEHLQILRNVLVAMNRTLRGELGRAELDSAAKEWEA